MSLDELRALGWNESKTHNDVMISNAAVDVDAVTYLGEKVALIRDGRWVEAFA
jgi:leucyl aminopeptidase (aminopeptidase T)